MSRGGQNSPSRERAARATVVAHLEWILGAVALLAIVTVRHYALAPRDRRCTKGAEATYFVVWVLVTTLIVFSGGVLHWFGAEWLFFLGGALAFSFARLYVVKRTSRLGRRRSAAVYAAFMPIVLGIALFANAPLDSVGSIALRLGAVALTYFVSFAWAEFFFRAFNRDLDDPKRPGPRA